MHGTKPAAVCVLDLPDPCLLAMLRCLAANDDPASLLSAARAHSKLHQAAAVAFTNFKASVRIQQQADSVLLYLCRHSKHVSSVYLSTGNDEDEDAGSAIFHQLPPDLQLHSLHLDRQRVQLQPGGNYAGVLRPGLPLKQLVLSDCILLDGEEGLAAALPLLPDLEHLTMHSVRDGNYDDGRSYAFVFTSTDMLRGLQQLTHLELSCVWLPEPGPSGGCFALQGLQGMNRLLDLRLTCIYGEEDERDSWARVDADALASFSHLTRLELTHSLVCEPRVLAGKAQLQHLVWDCSTPVAGAAEVELLLSQLQSLQQLTHLCVGMGCHAAALPPAAYGALTANSRLRHLNIRWCELPAGVWQHIFPAGRRLPQLTTLDVSGVRQPSEDFASVPDCARLVSCCPGLRSLAIQELHTTAALLAPLTGLSSLQELTAGASSWASSDADTRARQGLEVVAQLIGLQQLSLDAPSDADGLLLQLTTLQRLTALTYTGPWDTINERHVFEAQAPGDEPVWRQLLRQHLDHSDPAVAQQAAAALAE